VSEEVNRKLRASNAVVGLQLLALYSNTERRH